MSKYVTIPERLAPWREPYETDPAINQAVIAAHIGCRESTVCDHIRRLGWVVPAHVRAARTRVKPAPLILSGRAAPSVWAWAQGVTVSTARHGGRHVEVAAVQPVSSVFGLAEGGAA